MVNSCEHRRTIRGKEVAIVQSTFPPTDNLMELLLLIDAAKRASAKRIIAVIPYSVCLSDRKDKPRVAIERSWLPTCLWRRASTD